MPDWARHVRPRLSSLSLSPFRENEIVEELSHHLEDRWRELVAAGVPEDEATRLALAEFRDRNLLARYLAPLEQAQVPAAATPAAPTGHVLGDIWQDTQYAARTLRRQRAISVAAVLTLAFGIGTTTAIFSIVDGVLLRPLPFPDEGRIVHVAATTVAGGENVFSPRGYWHFVNNNRSFQNFGGSLAFAIPFSLTGDGSPLQINVSQITLGALEVLGVFPEVGRLPTTEEDAPGGPLVALLSHELWTSHFGADPSVVGRVVQLNGTPREIIGVMPAGYDYPTNEVDAWFPLQLDPASSTFGAHFIRAIARLEPGITVQAAIDDARGLVARFPELGYGPGWFEDVFDGNAVVRPLREEIVGDARAPLLLAFGTVGFVLLIACSNVANLLLVQAEGRRQENAVRLALGCGRTRLARRTLIESAMLALMGGAAGVLLAYSGTRALVAIGPTSIPRLAEIGINGRALAFTLLVSALAGLLFGMLPALGAGTTRLVAALGDGTRGATVGRPRHHTRNALVIAQIALAFILVIGSGLMARSFQALRSVDPGFSAEGVLTFEVRPLPTKYPEPEAVGRFYDALIGRLEAVPGVTRAGAIDALPLAGAGFNFTAVIAEFPPAEEEFPPIFQVRRVTPGYFDAMDVLLVEGRVFTPDDHNRRLPSIIISDSVRAQYWPDSSPLGKRIDVGDLSARVVGVVGDVHHTGLDVAAEQFLYLPILDAAGGDVGAMTVTVRTTVEPLGLVSVIRNAVAELDGDLAISNVQSMQRIVDDSMSRTSFTMSVLLIAALIALCLGSLGVYGVLSYVTSQRVPEIGIRSALGASPGAVGRMVLSQGIWLAGLGLLIGLAGALALVRLMVAQLYEVSPLDSITFVAASAIVLAVATLASLLPAARAARVPPVEALRGG